MIFEAIVSAVVALLTFLAGLLGDLPAPDWLTSLSGPLGELVALGDGMGAWVPWSLARTIFLAVLASMAVGLGIKLVRIVASFLTAGGGSAA